MFLSSHFRDVQVFRLGSPDCSCYEQIVVFAIARSRRERDRARDSEIFFQPEPSDFMARHYEMLTVLSEKAVELRVPPTARRNYPTPAFHGRNRRPAAGVSGVPPDCADTRSAADCAQYEAAHSFAHRATLGSFDGRALERDIWFW